MVTNGYVLVYLPNHPRAMSNGCVYEHIIQAERKLGRFLGEEEVVHHKDRNRMNNNLDNLMIFKTSKDHSSYHGGAAIRKEGDVYVAIQEDKKRTCPICGKAHIGKNSKMCIDCRNKEKAKNIPEKDKNYRIVKKGFPYTQIGKLYGVSDNAVREWCKKYGIPSTRLERKACGM